MKIVVKITTGIFAGILFSFVNFMPVSAHVVVRPAEVKTAARTIFAVSVPNEHDTSVVKVRLVVPDNLSSVRPFEKPGWTVSMVKSGEGEDAKVTEITWTGGRIGVGLKDEFQFGAMAPEAETNLQWKAYETYANGLEVAWDQEPDESKEDNKPFSVTEIVTETEAETAQKRAEQAAADADKAADRAFYTAIIAMIVGIAGILLATRQKKSE